VRQVAYIAGERSVPRLRVTPVPAGTKKLQRLGSNFLGELGTPKIHWFIDIWG
jgi:hypothetical protein